jgi:thymidylate synthase
MPQEDTSHYEDLNPGRSFSSSPDDEGRPGDAIDPIEFPTLNEEAAKSTPTTTPNHVDRTYQKYLRGILRDGHESGDRTGTGTIKAFGAKLRFDLQLGFPALTTKPIWMKGVFEEIMWMLRGETNIRPLLQEGVSIWTDWPYDRYQEEHANPTLSKEEFEKRILNDDEFAREWGELGPVYGKQWRRFGGPDAEHVVGRDEPLSNEIAGRVDQIERLIEGLKTHPDSRRHVVDAWDPTVHGIAGKTEAEEVALSPCHYGFQCFTRELSAKERNDIATEREGHYGVEEPKYAEDYFDQLGIPRRALSLQWSQRSVDSFIGLPWNLAFYGLLTHLLADQVNMMPEEVIFSGGDCHIYKNHLDQVEELLSRTGSPEPPALALGETPDEITGQEWTGLDNYHPQPSIEAEIAV